MLVAGYRKEFCLPPNPKAQHLRCYAYLDNNISEVLPYLNTVLKGYQFYKDPPALTLRFEGKLITVCSEMIAINIVRDEAEADSILGWLKQEINDTWKRRREIKASLETAPKPRILDILRLLPKTNCRECGQPTCMVFATQLTEGSKALDDCRLLDEYAKIKLGEYLSQFRS
jgi:ArsR family metal-binding transcriptional regulator